jgi:hypothetical protein
MLMLIMQLSFQFVSGEGFGAASLVQVDAGFYTMYIHVDGVANVTRQANDSCFVAVELCGLFVGFPLTGVSALSEGIEGSDCFSNRLFSYGCSYCIHADLWTVGDLLTEKYTLIIFTPNMVLCCLQLRPDAWCLQSSC